MVGISRSKVICIFSSPIESASAGKEFTDWHGSRHLAHHFDSGRQAGERHRDGNQAKNVTEVWSAQLRAQ